jgi:mono/diheme cytochrome c family protein
MRSPRALALPVAAGLTAAVATFAIVMAIDGRGNEREGAGQAAAGQAAGPAEGRALFFEMGCASCHELTGTGSSGTIGPNLDARLAAHDATSLKTTIVKPPGSGGDTFSVMPDNFGERMNDSELDALVAYLLAARETRER